MLLVLLALLPAAEPAYRVGSATNRIAILPVSCERDLDRSLCSALGESIAVEVGKEPRVEVVTPGDLDVLLGAQAVADLSSCDKDDCFARQNFNQIDAAYLLSLSIGRIGKEARLVVRVVDLKRGTVIDRDDARALAKDEAAIEESAKDLVMAVLVRRGLASAPLVDDDERGVSPVFWVGALTGGLGLVAAGGGSVLGLQAYGKTQEISDKLDGMEQDEFRDLSREARTYAYGADLLFVGAAAMAIAGSAMMVAGAL
jgi:hypothetical protein